ncbi:MAG: hypothetical protein IKP99_05000 [Bacteroidales bacterium]|nr:hypothetical protein [Bacteroidales bacterium]
MENKLSSVRFLPWVGKNYKNGGVFNKRILVVGESHYCGQCDRKECEEHFYHCGRNYTEYTILKHLNDTLEKGGKTYTTFERALVGGAPDEEIKRAIWNSIAFYNYLQYALEKPRMKGEDSAYDAAEKPFFQVLDELKPELIIVWSAGGRDSLYEKMPQERWIHCDNKIIDDRQIPNGKFILSDKSEVPTLFIMHPSSSRFSWKYWYKVIKEFGLAAIILHEGIEFLDDIPLIFQEKLPDGGLKIPGFCTESFDDEI